MSYINNAGQTLGVNPGGTGTTTAVSRPFDPGIEEASGGGFRTRSATPGFGSRRGGARGGAPSGPSHSGHHD